MIKRRIRWFRSVRFQNDWELNFIGQVWNLRIARSQIALWRNYQPIFDFHIQTGDGRAWQDPTM